MAVLAIATIGWHATWALAAAIVIGVAIIGPAEHVTAWYLALGLIGLTQGMVSALWGVFLPVFYGTRHLGSVRSLVMTIMVVATAIGPGLTGILIDRGVTFPDQSLVLGIWCLALSAFSYLVQRRLTREMQPAPAPA